MYERMLGKCIKIVWQDNGNNKAIRGILNSYDKGIMSLTLDSGKQFLINITSVVSVKEVDSND